MFALRPNHPRIGVADTFWLFIFTLNRAKKMIQFNIQFKVESFNSKNYSIQNWTKIFLQKISYIGKIISASENRGKHAKWAVFSSKTLFIFLMNFALFWFIQKFGKNIHTKKILIQKNIWSFIPKNIH